MLVYLFRIIMSLIVVASLVNSAVAQEDIKELVRKVQAKNSRMHEEIDSLAFSGRSKAFSYGRWDAADMKLISETEEYLFDGIWSRPDSIRVVIKALRKTKRSHPFYYNSEFSDPEFLRRLNREYPLPNPFQFTYDVSSIGLDRGTRKGRGGERIDIWPVFPFAEGADSLYVYEYVATVGLDTKKLVKLFVSPRYENIPGVSGSFYIDPDEFAVVRSDVVFNNAARMFMEGNDNGMHTPATNPFVPMTMEEDHRIKTDKALFDSRYWLPERIEEDFTFEIMGFIVTINRQVEFNYYEINPANRTLRSDAKLKYDIDNSLQKELEKGLKNPNVLTEAEADSIILKAAARKSRKNLNTDIFDMESLAKDAYRLSLEQRSGKLFRVAGAWGEYFRYNRVEGPQLNYGLTFSNLLLDNTSLSVKAGYGFGDKRMSAAASAVWFPLTNRKFFIEGSLFRTIGYEEDRNRFSDGKVTFASLFYGTDYRDYYYIEGGSAGIGIPMNEKGAFKLSFGSRYEETAANTTRFSVFRNGRPFRPNPEIAEGRNNMVRFVSLYRDTNIGAKLIVEKSGGSLLGGEFSYGIVRLDIDMKQSLNRRNAIAVHLSGGGSAGSPPPQRWFDIGGKSLYNYSGVLRGTGYKQFTGEMMSMGTLEYTLKLGNLGEGGFGKPFPEMITQFLKVTAWIGFGYTDLSEKTFFEYYSDDTPLPRTTDRVYKEAGIGIGDQMNVIRFDFVRNSLSDNRILFSINVFR